MMKTIITILFTLFALQLLADPTPEEMYGQYDTDGSYRAMQEKIDEMNRKAEEAEREESNKKTMALWGAILIGLIPLGYIGKMVIKGKTWETNPRGTAQALATGLAGSAVLFGLNYGIFLLKIKYGDSFNSAFVFLIVVILVIAAIYSLRKKKE